jgi:hypothetical protein
MRLLSIYTLYFYRLVVTGKYSFTSTCHLWEFRLQANEHCGVVVNNHASYSDFQSFVSARKQIILNCSWLSSVPLEKCWVVTSKMVQHFLSANEQNFVLFYMHHNFQCCPYRFLTNRNLIQEDFKRWLNWVNACYHSVQSLLPSRLLSKNIKIRIYKT